MIILYLNLRKSIKENYKKIEKQRKREKEDELRN